MAECIQCFKRERWISPDGKVHYHKDKNVNMLLCGSCVQVLMKLTNKIPWNETLKEVVKPKVHGYRRRR